jgi:hypothetical protein
LSTSICMEEVFKSEWLCTTWKDANGVIAQCHNKILLHAKHLENFLMDSYLAWPSKMDVQSCIKVMPSWDIWGTNTAVWKMKFCTHQINVLKLCKQLMIYLSCLLVSWTLTANSFFHSYQVTKLEWKRANHNG